MNKPANSVADSMVMDQVHWVFPNDLNANDTVFGGMIMAQMDRICAVVACRHAQKVCVTASVDAVHFMAPAKRADVLLFSACVNRAWNSSMEIGCRVEAQRPDGDGADRHRILTAYMTFVAVDAEGNPAQVPALITETEAEQRRYIEADLRRASRLRHAGELKQLRSGQG